MNLTITNDLTNILKTLQALLPAFLIPILLMCAMFVSSLTQAIKKVFAKWIFGGWSVLLSFGVSLVIVFLFLSFKINFPLFSTPITLGIKIIATILVWASANGWYLLKTK